jgi:sugar (pentulose or hexulose) kinase
MGKRVEIREAFGLVGNVPTAAWLGWKIKWLQANQPEVYQKTWKVLTASAYITYQLTGVEPVIDYSEASGSFLMDAKRLDWSTEMFDMLELDPGILPRILPSSQVAGKVSRQAGMPVDQIRLVGGGAQSPLWNQIKANVYQLPVVGLKTFEGGTLGPAILAGVAGGVFTDEACAADQVVHIDHVLQPDPTRAGLYNRLFEVYKDLHDRMIEPFERLAQITN